MGLEKAILHGKEHRKPFRGVKAVDVSCRNHGGKTKRRKHDECPWCKGNRLHGSRVRETVAMSEEQAAYELNNDE